MTAARPSVQEVEFLVRRAVSAAMGQPGTEDDRVEFKSDWPDVDKARQLAANANKAAGELVYWVIGFDEKAQKIVEVTKTDVANWWPQMQKQFDQKSPALVRHTTVHVGDEVVIALTFGTNEVPYVVKSASSDWLEVPIRDGTRTRSARRDELIDMLMPRIHLPTISLTSASAHAVWTARSDPNEHDKSRGLGVRPEHTDLNGTANLFLEYVGERFLVLPDHMMAGTLHHAHGDLPLEVSAWGSSPKDTPVQPQYGVLCKGSDVQATGSGRFVLRTYTMLNGDHRDLFLAMGTYDVHLRLGIVGSSDPIELTYTMYRDPRRPTHDAEFYQDLGRWSSTQVNT